jgi:serine/threonine-protein kinase
MQTIKLNRQSWQFDENKPLGPPGGFGQVFACPDDVAIKRLNVSFDHAKRELTLAETLADRPLNHVVPVLDAGQDADSSRIFIVMPCCEMSLHDHLKASGNNIDFPATLQTLRDILSGLEEVGDIVHRDLKPANILRHDGKWKIADFGIARFVEDTTSLNTMRECLSPPYAAPEQWQNVRATKATDIYAWACIAHQMLSGRPLFDARDIAEWQQKHLHQPPPELPESVPGKLRSLISTALRKQPDLRPSLKRAIAVVDDCEAITPQLDLSFLAHVDAKISADNAAKEAAARQEAETTRRNAAINSTANADIPIFRDHLFSLVKSAASNAVQSDWGILLGCAELMFEEPRSAPYPFPRRLGGWDIFAAASIGITQSKGGYQQMSANLWFARKRAEDELRWWQTSFMPNANGARVQSIQSLVNQQRSIPTAIDIHAQNVVNSLSQMPPILLFAETPKPIDGEDFDAFAKLWLERFARAAAGEEFKPTLPMP